MSAYLCHEHSSECEEHRNSKSMDLSACSVLEHVCRQRLLRSWRPGFIVFSGYNSHTVCICFYDIVMKRKQCVVNSFTFFGSTEGCQEHFNLSCSLAQIRDIITAVDLTVTKYEKCQELQEVLARLENKSTAKLKNGKVFRKQDLHSKHRDLHHKGLVYWKTATGRLKGNEDDIICVTEFK